MQSDHSTQTTWPRTATDYARVTEQASARAGSEADREARSLALVEALWEAFGSARGPDDRGYSWVGVYYGPGQMLPSRYAGDGDAVVPAGSMLLGPCRNKPACSPIGLQGMCGKSWMERVSVVVDDVRTLGEGYIACDPKDQSELVVPLFEPGSGADEGPACWGVLDIDSYALGAFLPEEASWLEQACIRLGLSVPGVWSPLLRL